MVTTIDAAGRVVIPKVLRQQLSLSPGTEIDIQISDGHLKIQPVAVMTIAKRGRFFVAVAPPGTPEIRPEAVDEFLNDLREGRAR